MTLISRFLAFLGRHGAIGFALSIFLGLALPQFAALARPLLPVTIFCFTTVVFLRADPQVIAGLIRRPGRLMLAMGWLFLLPAALVFGLIGLIGREHIDPGLLLGLAIVGAAPPIMSAPAVAILFGFEPSLIIASVLGLTILSPVAAPLMVDLIAGQAVPLDRMVLMFRLALFIGGGFLVAMALRRLLKPGAVAAMKAELDGFGVVMYFVFAVAVLKPGAVAAMKAELDGFGVVMYFVFAVAAMDGVTAAAMARPALVTSFLIYAFALAGIGIVLALLLLRRLGPGDRFVVGYGTLQRNMGLLVAALGSDVPPTTFLYFALAQFPIYLAPWLLTPLARAIQRREAARAGKAPAQ